MTPQLVDHAYADSCIVIGCNLAEKMNMLISGRSHIAVTTVNSSLEVSVSGVRINFLLN